MKENGSFVVTLVLAIAGGAVIGMVAFSASKPAAPVTPATAVAPAPPANAPKPSSADTAPTPGNGENAQPPSTFDASSSSDAPTPQDTQDAQAAGAERLDKGDLPQPR